MNKLFNKLKESVINYWSDLFIVAMVVLWIADNIYESIIASVVTISSIILSFQVGYNCFDTSMWSSIGSNIALPLSAGGVTWLLKCALQHYEANKQGKLAHQDFPSEEDEDNSMIFGNEEENDEIEKMFTNSEDEINEL